MSLFLSLVAMTALAGESAEKSLDRRYFANKDVQVLRPEAFALQPESKEFLLSIKDHSLKEQKSLVELIKSDEELSLKIKNFSSLTDSQKEDALRKVFALEVKALNIKAPKLIIASDVIKGEAYFDFDLSNPGTGTVIINLEAIKKDPNPYTALMLLIHETRHSAQLQKAFDPSLENEAEALGFKAAFHAQKELGSKLSSFSDFLTLNNEYEAFSFGNYVVGSLTNWTVDTLGMGTYASQYNTDESFKIDLHKLFLGVEAGEIKDSVLDEFNRQENAQYILLKN